jgi:hypothetical protein
MLVVVLSSCSSNSTPQTNSQSPGIAQAMQAIERGHVVLYQYGSVLSDCADGYEPTTGLPIEGIGGCIHHDATERLAREYNDYIMEWVAQGNTPANSLLPHSDLISQPFAKISADAWVAVAYGKSVDLSALRVEYSKIVDPDEIAHRITVSKADDWFWTLGDNHARQFETALVADELVLAVRYVAGIFGDAREYIRLFDAETGIELKERSRPVPESPY